MAIQGTCLLARLLPNQKMSSNFVAISMQGSEEASMIIVHQVLGSCGAVFICAQFQNTPKYLVHADFALIIRGNPSFVRKLK